MSNSSNDADDGIVLFSVAHPRPTGVARLYWTLRCWWANLTWPIRQLWLTEKVELNERFDPNQ